MGLKTSKICVLVLGLSNAGKTHFIHLIEYGSNTSKNPTFGYNECNIVFEKIDIHMIEYGFQMSWDTLLHQFNLIYMLIRMDFTIEQILESKSIIIEMCRKLPKLPLCIIFVGKKNIKKQEQIKKLLQLEFICKNRLIANITIDFDYNFKEGLSVLLEWTIASGEVVKIE